MQCKCTYFLVNDRGVRVCSECDKPSPSQPEIEDKMVKRQETKAPLYLSDKDRAAQTSLPPPPDTDTAG